MAGEEREPGKYVFNLRVAFDPNEGVSVDPEGIGAALRAVAEEAMLRRLSNWGFFHCELGDFGARESEETKLIDII